MKHGILLILTMCMVFYPANSNSSVTFLDQLDYFPDPEIRSLNLRWAGDIIFIKSGFENGIINDAITITYDMYPAEDDGITLGAVLRSWDFGSQEGNVGILTLRKIILIPIMILADCLRLECLEHL